MPPTNLRIIGVAQPQFQSILRELSARHLPAGVTYDWINTEALNAGGLDERVKNADILFGEPSLVKHQLKAGAPNLKWTQLIMAGVDNALAYTKEIGQSVNNLPYRVTRAGGDCFGPHMSDYTLGMMLAHERHFAYWLNEQREHRWKADRMYTYRSMRGLKVGIMGASGSIGRAIAEKCFAFGMSVRGLSSSNMQPDNVITEWHRTTQPDQTKPALVPAEFLHDLDYLVNVMPSTSATRGMLDGDVLSACRTDPAQPAKTIFINIGRGDICSDETVLRALIGSNHSSLTSDPTAVGPDRWLASALLDVFFTEPLPSNHRFYSLAPPLMTITPHISGMSAAAKTEIVDLFIENLTKFMKKEPLLFELDHTKGY